MKKLNKREWYLWLERVEEMVDYSHEDYEVQKILADLWFTLAEMPFWQLPTIIWRTYKIEKAMELHKDCCDLN